MNKAWERLEQLLNLILLIFADDTSAIGREATSQDVEKIIQDTLRLWGEDTIEKKTERLVVGKKESNTKEHVRLLGGWLSWDGTHDYDSEQRRYKAKMLWNNLCPQLSRRRA